MRALIYGVGAVGARAARQLASSRDLADLVLVGEDLASVEEVAASLGSPARALVTNAIRLETRLDRFREVCEEMDVVILTAAEDHFELAETALLAGAHVVSVSDDLSMVERLQGLDQVARHAQRNLVLGAGFSPGFSCLLARHAANELDVVDEIHFAKSGTGGPACARQHHRSLRSDGLEWRNQKWEKRHGGTGRELCWFPDPVGGLDCYQGSLPEPLLILPAFSGLVRCTARVAATRRDVGTKWLPMMRKPHPEGMIGGIRVEVRGWSGTARDVIVYGALDRPAVAAGAIAATAASAAVAGSYVRYGAGGLAELVQDPLPMLQELSERGIRAAVFEGMTSPI